jgi:hypothetical protein
MQVVKFVPGGGGTGQVEVVVAKPHKGWGVVDGDGHRW